MDDLVAVERESESIDWVIGRFDQAGSFTDEILQDNECAVDSNMDQ